MFGAPRDLSAHLGLLSSTPAAGDSLDAAPREIVLTFTEEIDLPLSRLTLTGPAGAIDIGAIEASDAAREMRAGLPAGLGTGNYRVDWQAVGRDGHPVRGSFSFTVTLPDEEGATVPLPEAAPPSAAAAQPAPPDGEFNAQSPLYVLVRWVNYLGILGSIGSVTFIALLRRTMGSAGSGSPRRFMGSAVRSATFVGLGAVGLLGISIVLRLQAQSQAILGGGLSQQNIGVLLGSDWGSALILQGVAAAALAVGLALSLRAGTVGLGVASVASIALVCSAALTSHAASVRGLRLLAIVADSLHILAAAAWLGTLLMFVVAGVPQLLRLEAPDRAETYPRLLRAFSALALIAGGLVVMTGAFSANLQLTGPSDLLNTRYGLVLLAKLIVAAGVFALGALNWRRLPRRQQDPDAVEHFRRRAALELCIALLVVAATATLVAIPPPSHEEAMTSMTADPRSFR